MTGLTRKDREKARHRLEILEAAEAVFAEKGFHGATAEEIARRAEFAVGTIYNFFAGKEDLYIAVIVERANQMLQVLSKVLSESAGDPMQAIERFVEEKAAFFAEHAPFFRLFHKEQLGGGPILNVASRQNVFQIVREGLSRIEAVMREGVERGLLKKAEPCDLALALQGITNSFLIQSLDSSGKIDYKAKVGFMKALFFKGALAGE